MSLNEKDIKQIAKLSSFSLSDEEVEMMKVDLTNILDHFKELSEVNTEGVEATSHVHGVVNALRDDITKASLEREEVVEIAPDTANGGFRVPRII